MFEYLNHLNRVEKLTGRNLSCIIQIIVHECFIDNCNNNAFHKIEVGLCINIPISASRLMEKFFDFASKNL
ncbi:hypothetical protein BpHYR1_029513 [Brachionus plicatilis]|uniref:Uncharacterized protein n=1 Tax=Brachionus plicatilis TaxID=10195 RepID=A0A3M7RPW9_BRAPC|nr:hypothetical protein BpHYR1_029513 [Brachionus plicatilis]